MNETNAERLETTKKSIQHAREFIGEDGVLSFQYGEKVLDDFDWVIEQAERVPELEKKPRRWQNNIIGNNIKLVKENERLREAFNKFESAMESEIDWQIKNSKSDRRAQFQNGSLHGMRNIERQWIVACQELKGGVQHEDTHKT